MGILEDLLNSAMSGQQGMGQSTMPQAPAQGSGGGMSGTLMSLLPVVLAMLSNRGGAAAQPGTEASAGGLGDILGQVVGGGRLQQGGGLGGILGGVMGGGAPGAANSAGGLGALLEQMRRAGYGEHARSWVGTGQNMPIAPAAWEQILGRGGVAEIARHAGVSESEASQGLSALVPQVVDRITPGGEVPDVESLAASVDQFAQQLRQSQ